MRAAAGSASSSAIVAIKCRVLQVGIAYDLSRTLGLHPAFSEIEFPFWRRLRRRTSQRDRRSRLFDADDWVRTEIDVAFSQGKEIVPVLIGGAVTPPATALPVII